MPYIGQRPSKGDENNFKILDDISSYTLTFDGSDSSVVSAANDTITSLTHRFVQGQRVTYNKGGGTVIAGLSDGVYYIIKEDHNTIKLATSASNASNGVAVNITGVGGGASHTINVAFDGINTKFKATHTNGVKARITRSAQLVISINGVIQQPHDTATPSTGFGFDLDGTIVFSQAPVATDEYWAHVLTNNNVTFDISDNDIDNFTGNGSTTTFNLSKSPPDNRNILVTIDGVIQYPNDPDGTVRSYNVVENVLTFVTAPASGVEIQVRHIGFAGSTSGSGSGGVTSFYGRTGAVVLKNTDNVVVNNATIEGDLTVNGTTTTLDTNLIDVDKIEVTTAGTNVAVAVTHNGTGDLIRLYDGASQKVTVDDEGNVGIGSVIPAEKLDVSGKIKVGSNGVILSGDDVHGGGYPLKVTTSHGYVNVGPYNASYAHFVTDRGRFYFNKKIVMDEGIISSYNENLVLATNAGVDEHVHITTAGKVGINSTSPSSTLDVVGGYQALGLYRNDFTGNSGAGIELNFGRAKANGDLFNCATVSAVGSDNTGQAGQLRFSVLDSGSMDEKLRITSDGKIGVGVDPANYPGKFVVSGDTFICDRDIHSRVASGIGNSDRGFKQSIDGVEKLHLYANNASDIILETSGGSEKVRITSAGKIGIGTDSPDSDAYIHIVGPDNGKIILEDNSNNGANLRKNYIGIVNSDNLVLAADEDNLGSSSSIRFRIDGDEKVRIVSNGRVGIGTDSPASRLDVYDTNALGILSRSATTQATDTNKALKVRNNSTTDTFNVSYKGQGYFAGKVGIGTETPGDILHLRNTGPIIKVDATNNSSGLRVDILGQTGGSNNQLFRVQRDATTKFQINDDGDVVITGDDNAEIKLKCGTATGNGIIAFLNSSGSTKGNIFYDTDDNFMVFKTNGTASSNERLRIRSDGNVDINGTPPWTVSGGDFRNLSISGEGASASGFLWLGNGAATNNADFDLGRINFLNGGTIVARVIGTTDTSANDDGVLRFNTKKTGETEAERLRITSDGKVGVNESSPDHMFHIKGTSADNNPVLAVESDSWVSGRSAALRLAYTDGNAREIRGHYENGLQFILNNGEAMRIATDGRVGINTTSFDYDGIGIRIDGRDGYSSHWPALQIKGVGSSGVHAAVDLVATEANNLDGSGNPATYRGLGVLMYDEPSDVEWFAGRPYAGSDQYIIGRKSGGYRAESAEKVNSLFRLYSGGRLALGDDNGTAAAGMFQVIHDGGGNQNGDTLCHFETNANDWIFNLENDEGASTAHFVYFKKDGNNPGSITASNTQTNYNTSGSDRELKKNFESWTEDTLSLFKNINPQKFHFKLEDDSEEKTKGFIAQDMLDKFPEAYPKDRDGYYKFNPSGMVAYLMKALQEEIVKREALEARISALEGS